MRTLRFPLLALALALAFAPGFASAEPAHGDEHAAPADDHAAAGDHAAEGEHHAAPELNVASLARHTINLAVLLGILFVALKGPTVDFLAFRRTNVKELLDDAWSAKADAEAQYRDLETRLDHFETELERLIEAVRDDAVAEKKKLLAAAETSAEQLEAAAARSAREEVSRAHAKLRDEAVALSTALANDILGKAITSADQQRLNSDYLARVEEAANA